MCLMYASTCRASELCRFEKDENDLYKPSVTKDQFIVEGPFLKFREAIVLKRRELDPETGLWGSVTEIDNYPKRNEISLPIEGGFSIFTVPIIHYLDRLDEDEELFKFKYRRGWQIVNYVTGEMQHYLRDMGIKFYSRLLDRNIKDLQEFTGHARIKNLAKYLGEGQLESKLTKVKI